MNKEEDEVCEDCNNTGIVTEGEFDNNTEKKCHCLMEKIDEDDDN